jgi:hypothetical protein
VTTGSDNPYPKVIVVEGSAPASPAAGRQALFIDTADHKLKRKDSAGASVTVEGIGDGGNIGTYVDLTDQGSDPSSPASGSHRFYSKAGGLYVKSPAGAVVGALGAGGGGGGAGADTGGTYFRYPLDRGSLHGTYGDEFDGASLNARWTRSTQTSGEETYQLGPRASALRVAYSTGAASRYIYQTAPNGTNETWETSLTVWQPTTTGQMFALVMLDTSGNGVGTFLYDNTQGIWLGNITAGGYASSLATTAYGVDEHRYGRRYWLRLRKASGLYAASYSFDGENYSPEVTGTPTAFTPARVGIGRILGTTAGDTADWHWFDKTA